MLVAQADHRLENAVSDESMGTLVVWFALGLVLSWLRVLPIDNVAHTAGGTVGARRPSDHCSEWKRREAWARDGRLGSVS